MKLTLVSLACLCTALTSVQGASVCPEIPPTPYYGNQQQQQQQQQQQYSSYGSQQQQQQQQQQSQSTSGVPYKYPSSGYPPFNAAIVYPPEIGRYPIGPCGVIILYGGPPWFRFDFSNCGSTFPNIPSFAALGTAGGASTAGGLTAASNVLYTYPIFGCIWGVVYDGPPWWGLDFSRCSNSTTSNAGAIPFVP